MSRPRAFSTLLAALLLLPTIGSGAEERTLTTQLGNDGQLVSLVSGTYGELFPAGSEAESDTAVLALRWSLPGGREEAAVIPATLDPDTEGSAGLIIEPESGVHHVFWQSWSSPLQSRLLVSSFDGQAWTDYIEVAKRAFAWRTSATFAVTRDSYSDLTGAGGRISRTVLHVAWCEEQENGLWKTIYAPLVLENGVYIGDHSVLVLNDLLAEHELATPASEVRIAPALRPRDSENAVVVSFLDQASGKLAVIELSFAAGELSLLGDMVEQEILEVGSGLDLKTKAGSDGLVAAVHKRLEEFAQELKPEILGPLAASVESHLREQLGNGGSSVRSIGGAARVQLVDVGFRLTDGRMHRSGAGARVQLVDVGARTEGRPRRHDARSSVANSISLPDTLAATPEVLVSSKGHRQILVWQEQDRIRYQESSANGGWSTVQQIKLTPQLDAAKAMDVLSKRVENQ